MNTQDRGPQGRGEPALRLVPRPADANAGGDIFGGWVLSQMDIAGGTVASQRAKGRTVTVAIEAMTFHRPIYVGDLVSLYARIDRVGTTSIAIHIETVVRRRDEPEEITVTEGTFVYVAVDQAGRPRPLPPE